MPADLGIKLKIHAVILPRDMESSKESWKALRKDAARINGV